MRFLAPIVTALAISPSCFAAAAPPSGESLFTHCVNCHGVLGQGGEDGKYPRIAGLPADYVLRQLEAFKSGKRHNKPMLPIFQERSFDTGAMRAVATYVAGLPNDGMDLPPFQPSTAALAEFDSREEFGQLGEEIFQDNCAQCHGEDGRGRADKGSPPLVDQFPAYLARQIADFAAARREHEHAAKMFGEMYPEEREAVLEYIQRLGRQ